MCVCVCVRVCVCGVAGACGTQLNVRALHDFKSRRAPGISAKARVDLRPERLTLAMWWARTSPAKRGCSELTQEIYVEAVGTSMQEHGVELEIEAGSLAGEPLPIRCD